VVKRRPYATPYEAEFPFKGQLEFLQKNQTSLGGLNNPHHRFHQGFRLNTSRYHRMRSNRFLGELDRWPPRTVTFASSNHAASGPY
jgi:hypothetical protein